MIPAATAFMLFSWLVTTEFVHWHEWNTTRGNILCSIILKIIWHPWSRNMFFTMLSSEQCWSFLLLVLSFHIYISRSESNAPYPFPWKPQDAKSTVILFGRANCESQNTIFNIYVSCKWPRRILDFTDDNFQVRVLDSLTRNEALLELTLTGVEEIIKDINIRGSLGCSDHALVEFVILSYIGLARWEVRTLNFRLFKELLDEISWEAVKVRGLEPDYPWVPFWLKPFYEQSSPLAIHLHRWWTTACTPRL